MVDSDADRPFLDVENPWYRGYDFAADWTPPPDALGRTNGRRPKWADNERMAALLSAVEQGLYAGDVANAAGIARSVYFEWRAGGASPAVKAAIEAAETVLKRRMLRHVTDAAPTQWQAAMTLLERRFPSEWSRRDRVTHEHAGAIGLEFRPAEMNAEAALLAADLEAELAAAEQVPALLPHIEADGEPGRSPR